METYEIKQMLENHRHWYYKDCAGWEDMKADLKGTSLYRADLRGAFLSGADLSVTNLYGADLGGADLTMANLYGANLENANLRHAYLRDADLREATLCGADLRLADMHGALLREADMYEASTEGATGLFFPLACPSEGSFIGWKRALTYYRQLHNIPCVVKLQIPAAAKRCSSTSTKCRCDLALVLEVQNLEGDPIENYDYIYSSYDPSFRYRVGDWIRPEKPFEENRWNTCSSGIHFFVDREEATRY